MFVFKKNFFLGVRATARNELQREHLLLLFVFSSFFRCLGLCPKHLLFLFGFFSSPSSSSWSDRLSTKNTYLQTSHELETWHVYRITINQSLIFRKIISQQPQEVNSQFLHRCTDRCLSKNIDTKLKNHISTTTRGKFTIWALLCRSLILKQIFTKRWPQFDLYFLSNRKSKLNILKNHISTTARGKFTIFAPLYRSLIVKKYLQKSDPNLTFTSWPNRKSKFTIKKNYISTTARGKFTICALLYRSLILQKICTKRWPQFDLYFLSKPEVKV